MSINDYDEFSKESLIIENYKELTYFWHNQYDGRQTPQYPKDFIYRFTLRATILYYMQLAESKDVRIKFLEDCLHSKEYLEHCIEQINSGQRKEES